MRKVRKVREKKTKFLNKRKTKFKTSSCSQGSVKSANSRSRHKSDSPEITEIEIVDCEQESPMSYKKMTIPLFPNELRNNNQGNAQVSPEKAFEVINQLKMQSMLPQQQPYNPPQLMGQHVGYPSPHMYRPPPHPRLTQQYHPSYFTPTSHPLKGYDDVTEMAITADEAAMIINDQIRPRNRVTVAGQQGNNFVSPEDAAAMLRVIREKRNQSNNFQPMRREQTVLLRPHEVANMVNAFRSSKLPPQPNDAKGVNEKTENNQRNNSKKNNEKNESSKKKFKSPAQPRS